MDSPLQMTYYPSYRMGNTGLATILASYTWGFNAKRWQAMPDEEIFDRCISELAKAHKLPEITVKGYFIRGVVKHWALDPFARGAFVLSYPHHVSLH